ncbi:hypothetical protein [Paenibacillus humicus]|uniref:hypothetical protein n=1 Tax=Paenibacillus humicus TaxID=412861 RepID=UPI000FD6C19F|nr:hypothetical protein [Paenibacillus humicus]
MNWEMFIATITWVVTVLAVGTALIGFVNWIGDEGSASRKGFVTMTVAVPIAALCVATIAGMGWGG